MPLPLVILLMALMLFAMPIWLPLVAMLDHRERKRRRAVADRTACRTCGAMLGTAALARADAAWADHIATLFQANPGIRFRLVRHVYAICPRCAVEYDYDPHRRVFMPTEDGKGLPNHRATGDGRQV